MIPHRLRRQTHFVFRLLVFVAAVASATAAQFLFAPAASADPYPPLWGGGAGPAVHDAPVPWPAEPADPLDCGETCGDWQPYPYFQVSAKDPRVQDPSNGGTSPQNYVNISSSCVDQAKPSVYYYLDTTNQVLLFRWRVEQIANNYATGPTPGAFGATSPWNSGLWTVFFDVNGDGYRDLAAHLNGSSGDPSTAVDRVVGIWGDVPSNQSLDYPNDPNIHLLGHNPTGFVDAATARLLNFRSSLAPTAQWPNGAAERTWDYGTTRSRLITKANAGGATCDEYFVDYQIPLAMLDAAALGGPAVEPNLPLAMLFCTANSLNNPFQKDCLYQGAWIGDPNKPAPFGDYLTLAGEKIVQPIVDDITAEGCGPVNLGAQVKDTLQVVNGVTTSSLTAVDFYYYADTNGDGSANDGSTWTLAAAGTQAGLNRWTAQWKNTSPVLSGAYLIGVQAVDSAGKNPGGSANRTFSYLTATEVGALTPPGGEIWLANPRVTGAKTTLFDVNTCGAPPPYVAKQASAPSAPAGSSLQFTVTVHNTRATPLDVSAVSDQLPPGFSFETTSSSSLGTPATQPPAAATGTITWTFAPPAAVPPASSRELVFTATAALIAGSYNNVAAATTGEGTLLSEPLPISVGAPRLTIVKSASAASLAPGSLVTYTIGYANHSPVDVTGARITDVVPAGLGSVMPLDGGVYNDAAREIVWDAGALAAGEGPYGVRFVATVDTPYLAATPLVNTATIASEQTAPAAATNSVFVSVPRPQLLLQKSVSPAAIAPGEDATFTLQYRNAGDALAAGVVITDPIPAGFTFVSATGGGSSSGGQAQWNIGDVAAGGSGSVQLVLKADDPYAAANPQANTGWISSAQTGAVSATAMVGVQGGAGVCTTFYFHDDTANVGQAGTQKLALAQAPLVGDTPTGSRITAPGNSSSYLEVARFYQDPAASGAIVLTGPITTSFYIDRENGPGLFVRATVYDYDTVTGATTQLGQSTTEFLGGERGLLEYIAEGNGTLESGHRLLWVFEARSKTNQTVDVLFQYGGTVPNSVSDTSLPIATTFADSRSVYCAGTPAALTLQKQVSQPFVAGGETLSYTLEFNNVGGAAAVNVEITDTLAAGLTYVGAALNGTAVPAPLRGGGQQVVFAVNSPVQPAGTVAQGAGGVLVLTATVDAPVVSSVTVLPNTAAIAGENMTPVTATAESRVVLPLLTVAKRVDKGTLRPGERATYAVLVQNAGSYTATGVTVSDALPLQTYYTYVAGSTAVNHTPAADSVTAGVLNLALGELAPGATAIVTFQMEVATSGVPDGVTILENSAAVASAQTSSVTSEVAVVAINTNPSLVLSKYVAASGSPAAGSVLTYTLIVTNTGAGDALGVEVVDPLPARTSYVPNSLRFGGVPSTDAADADNGSFATAANRVRFAVGTLAQGASAAMTFQVQLDEALPSGTTPVANVATATAANTTAKTAQVTAAANAAPLLGIEKRGPAVVAWPAAVVTASLAPSGAPAAAGAGSSTTFTVDSTAQLAAGQYIVLGGQPYRIAAIAGRQVTVDGSVNAAPGTPVIAGFVYAIAYRNEGSAAATNVVITDTLPAGLTLITAAPGATVDGSSVVWNVGTLAPDTVGAVELAVFPTGPGVYLNTAAIDSDETGPTAGETATAVGGLVVRKRTTTPAVVLTQAGAAATYIVEVQNTLPRAVGGVHVTDTLAPGFVYHDVIAISGGTRAPVAPQPLRGSEQPAWGVFTIPAYGTLAITFTVDILPSTGPAVYQNAVVAAAPGAAVVPFDELATTDEDVEVLVTTLAAEAKVTYYAWLDRNGDGLQDTTESGVPGATVHLLDAGGNVVRTTTTGADGRCTFAKLPPGTYVVQTVLPQGYSFTQQDVMANTADFADSDADPATGKSAAFALAAGGHNPTLAAGLTLPAAPAGVAGRAWHDTNRNGVQESTETGVGGVTVMLYRATGGGGSILAATLQTNAQGRYAASNLPPGSYYAQFASPAGYAVTVRNAGGSDAVDSDADPATGATDPTALAAGQKAEDWDLGLYLPDVPARLNGHTWIDTNGNGVDDPAEPRAAGVVVVLYRANGEPLAQTETAADGAYLFDNLAPAAYYLHFALPEGYVRTTPDQGDDARDSDSGQETGRTSAYTLVAGETNATVDAGYIPLLTVGGLVFNDFRNNGVYEPSEDFGVDGVQVNVYADLDGSGKLSPADGAPLATTVTTGAGVYRFAGLAAGDYVLELDPANFGNGGLLDHFVSSLKASRERAEPEIDPDDDVDGDDNGYNSVREAADTVLSRAVTLGMNTEPVNDGDGNPSSNLAVDFGIYDPAIGGSIWWDADRDGVQDVGEPGLDGVGLNLYQDSNGSGELDAGDSLRSTTTSLADGAYIFTFLAPGEYLVQVTAENFAAGSVLHLWSPTTGGGDPDDDDNSDSNGAPSPLGGVAAKALTLTSSGEPTDDGDGNEYTNLSLDFGFWPNPGSIGGLAWQDGDGDGLQDSGEARLGGITVTLYSTSNVPLATATTGSDGHYRFGDLPAGEYYEVFTPPGNRRLTVANSGSDDAADSDAENGGRTATIPLTNGWDAVHWDVGLLAPTGEEERPEPGLTQSLYLPAIQR